MLFIEYPKCSTCQKAKKWLEEHNITYTDRHIVEDNPTYEELKEWQSRSGLPLKKFFNTSIVSHDMVIFIEIAQTDIYHFQVIFFCQSIRISIHLWVVLTRIKQYILLLRPQGGFHFQFLVAGAVKQQSRVDCTIQMPPPDGL